MAINDFIEAFTMYGSDKSGFHTYEYVYDNLFEDRSVVSEILEVGIAYGGSARAWKSLFPNAMITGLDNNIDTFFHEDRIVSMFVDQTRGWTFDNFIKIVKDTKYDLIIDDGCHSLNETVLTFRKLLPLLKHGGIFVVEDIREDLLPSWIEIVEELKSHGYKYTLYNMMDKATCYDDNIVITVEHS